MTDRASIRRWRRQRASLKGLASGHREQDRGEALASASTLNCLQLTPANAGTPTARRATRRSSPIKRGSTASWWSKTSTRVRAPAANWLNLDATDAPLQGHQEGRCFNDYYGQYCYLALYITSGERMPCARLRTSDSDVAEGGIERS